MSTAHEPRAATHEPIDFSRLRAEDLPEVLTLAETAAFLKVPENTLYYWRANDEGPRSFRLGKYVRYRRAAIIAHLDKLEAAA